MCFAEFVIDDRFFEGRVGFVSLRRMRIFQGFLRRRYVGRVEELGMVAMTWYCVSCEYELTDRADIYLFLRMRHCSCGGNCYRFSRCQDFCQLLLQRYFHPIQLLLISDQLCDAWIVVVFSAQHGNIFPHDTRKSDWSSSRTNRLVSCRRSHSLRVGHSRNQELTATAAVE